MTEEEIKAVVEQFKASLSIEELDELERQYNALLKKAKEEQEKSGSNE